MRALRAFTLIELLVCLAIITLLVGVLLPALGKAREAGKASACLSNVRLLAMASLMYAQHDSKWRFVPFIAGSDRKQLLLPYTNSGTGNDDLKIEQLWHCPNIRNVGMEAGYGFSSSLNNTPLNEIAKTSATVALSDAGINDAGAPITATHVFPPSRATFPAVGRPNPRHDGRANVGWVDGHAGPQAMEPPFYPSEPYPWPGVNVTDRHDPNYRDELWDRY